MANLFNDICTFIFTEPLAAVVAIIGVSIGFDFTFYLLKAIINMKRGR